MTNFSRFYGNVRQKHAELIRKDVEKLVSSQTFRNWEKEVYEPDAKFWVHLNAIAKRYGYEPIYTL